VSERHSTADEDIVIEGSLNRKHEWESTTKKASNRSWDKVYVVLRSGVLIAYKDQKHFRQEPEVYYRNEGPIDLKGVVVEIAANYTKKKHVFRLKLQNGAEYLFQAKEDEEMNLWINKIQSTISDIETSPGPSRSQTMPAKGEDDKKDEPKKRGFFTLKKK
jgi:spectrin beta